jgi:predicted TPR repeat methyltransferase
MAMNRKERRARAKAQSRQAVELRRSTAQDDGAAVLAASHRLFEMGRMAEALPGLREACARDGADLRLRAAFAYALATTGHVGAAVEQYRAMLEIEPQSAPLMCNLAVLLIGLGARDEARTLLERAAAIDPGHADTAYTLGELNDRQKRQAEAFHHFRRAVRLFRQQIGPRPGPGRCHDLVKLATAQIQTGEVPASLATFERALALRPDHPLALARRGLALARLRRYPEAIASLKRAAAVEPNHAELQRALGDLLSETGEEKAAQLAYQAALKINPRDALSNYFLAALQKSTQVAAPPTAYVEQLFDEYAGKFDKHLVEVLQYRAPELLAEAVARVTAPPRSEWTVVDLGCGTGLCGPLMRPYARTLIGVDLSSGMLDKARARGIYDDLRRQDVAAGLAAFDGTLDLAVSADVFVYLGDLAPVFAAAARALRSGGWFAFTTEVHAGEGFVLEATKRYRHSRGYLEDVAAAHGFRIAHAGEVEARQEKGTPVMEHLMVWQKS